MNLSDKYASPTTIDIDLPSSHFSLESIEVNKRKLNSKDIKHLA